MSPSIFFFGTLLLLLLFGFSFHMIGIGLLATLAPFSKVAYVLFIHMASPREPHAPFVSPPVKLWFIVHVALRSFIGALGLVEAIYLLANIGFCGKNLICLPASSLGVPVTRLHDA